MIDVSNLKDTLKTLGFIAYGDIYEKAFSEFQVGQSMALASMVGTLLIALGILFGKSFFKKVEV